MKTSQLPIKVRYLGIYPSPSLRGIVETEAAKLNSYAKQVEGGELQVGDWRLHHNKGHLYRVSLELELAGGGSELVTTRESALNPEPEALVQLLRDTLDASLVRLDNTAQRRASSPG